MQVNSDSLITYPCNNAHKMIMRTVQGAQRRSRTMDENRNVDVDKKEVRVERKSDSSMVASTFIKYAAYIIILAIVLWFLVKYIFPMFS